MPDLGVVTGLFSSAGDFLRAFFSIELEPRHRFFLSIGVRFAGGGFVLLFVLALIIDLTPYSIESSFIVVGAMIVLGLVSIAFGIFDSREVERIEGQRRQERLEQDQAETARAWAEAGMYQAGRATLEDREDIVMRVQGEDREFQIENPGFESPTQDPDGNEDLEDNGTLSVRNEEDQDSREAEEND